MSLGRINRKIVIVAVTQANDAEGFARCGDTVLAAVQAYREDRHTNERWANMAAFSAANTLFRFRRIPNVAVDASLFILCGEEQFRILSVEDIRGRGMYLEVLAEKVEPTIK